MSCSPDELIENFCNSVEYILNILPANRDQITSKVCNFHTDKNCGKDSCQIGEFLTKHTQYLQSVAQRLERDFSYFERITSNNYKHRSNRNGFYQRDRNSRRNFHSTRSIEGIDVKSSFSSNKQSHTQPVENNNNNSNLPCTSKQANYQANIPNNELNTTSKSKGAVDDAIYDEDDDHMLFNHSIYHLEQENPIRLTQDLKSAISENSVDLNNNYLLPADNQIKDTNNQIKPQIVNNSNNHEKKCTVTENIKAANIANITIKSNDKNCTNDELNMSKEPVDLLNNTFCHTSLSGADKMSSGIDTYKAAHILRYNVYIPSREYKCWITHVESPFLIWTQQQCFKKQIEELDTKLQKFYNNPECNEKFKVKPEKLRKELYVAALFSLDKKWYRGKIIKFDEFDKSKATVFYYDYGNSEEVKLEDMRFLIEKFIKKYPVLATPISIANVCPNDLNDWPQNVVTRIRNFLNNREATFSAVKNSNWPILFGKFEVTANKKKYGVLDYIITRKIGQAMYYDYITEKYRKYMETHDQIYKFINYVEIQELEAVNLREAKEIGLSLINEAVNDENAEDQFNKEINLSEFSDEKGEEHFENLKAININSLEESIVCHEEKHFITNFEKNLKLKNLKRKLFELDENAEFKFKVISIKNPYKFYVTLVNENHDEYIEMLKELNDFYQKNEVYLADLAKKMNYSFVIENLLCVAKSKNNIFYRAYVKNFIDFDDEIYDYLDDKYAKEQKISVCYLENGETEELTRADLFPIAKEYCEKEAYCFCCCLDMIEPIGYSDMSLLNQDYIWPKDAVETFKQIVQVGNIYSAQSLEKKFAFSKISCEFENPIKVLILNDKAEKDEDLRFINEVLVSEHHLAQFTLTKTKNDEDNLSETPSRCAPNKTALKFSASSRVNFIPNDSETTQEEFKKNRIDRFLDDCIVFGLAEVEEKKKQHKDLKEKELKQKQLREIEQTRADLKEIKKRENASSDPLDNWNPTKEHFESVRNAYFFNEESYEAHKFGYETKYQGNICRSYLKTGGCFRNNCPFIHQMPSDELVFSSKAKEKQPIILDLASYTFEIGDMLFLNGVSYMPPNIINASVMGHYNHNLKTCVSINNFSEINELLNKYYGKKKFAQEKTTLYSIGQIVAAKNTKTNSWYRGKITQIFPDDNIDNEKFQVFYVDFGYSEILSIKDMYPIKKAFSTYPQQNVQLEIFNTRIENVPSFIKYIDEVSQKTDYFYAMIYNVGETLEVFLYGYHNNEAFCINDEILKRGFGYQISKVSRSSFHYMKLT